MDEGEKEIAKERQQMHLKSLEKHLDKSKERKEYAVKQFDYLMIILSTACMGFVFTYTKDMKVGLTLARISQMGFLLCLLSNLFSQIASMWCNDNALENAEERFDVERYNLYEKEDEQDEKTQYLIRQNDRTKKMVFYGTIVKTLNVSAFIFLLSAIILFVIFATIS